VPRPRSRQQAVQHDLLAWYRQEQRDLPWRRTRDPYAIWISEVMCQQTQVATVIPHWERFLARFPNVTALAEAPADDVLALWSGLGYYARARNLHRAAQAIVRDHGGVLPADPEALGALPGFGPYTAGAVGSIALGLDVALVDGNVARVFCRLEGWELGSEDSRARAWEIAPAWLPSGRAGDWNQALMELGATICGPSSPSCQVCPVRAHCAAVRGGDPARYPLPKVRRPRKVLRLAAGAIRKGGAVLLVRRAEEGLFGGLWGLPSLELEGERPGQDGAVELSRTLFGKPAAPVRIGAARQTLTHREVEVEVFELRGERPHLPEGSRWVTPPEMTSLGFSSLAVKVLRAASVPVPDGHGRRGAVSNDQGSLF
jgi:A/G-specific adenine glycosylase